MKDPYLKLVELSSEIWNERKSIDYTYNKASIKRTLKRLDKLTKELKELDFEKENNTLKEIHSIT
jgi:hypothetical protein